MRMVPALVIGVILLALLLSPSHLEGPVIALAQQLLAAGPAGPVPGVAVFNLVETVGNIAVFVPLGACLMIATRRLWLAVGLATLLSAASETGQLFLPGRVASFDDVLANVVGALAGALLALALGRVMPARLRTGEASVEPARQAETPATPHEKDLVA